jgi:hypothetical protein
VNAIFAASTKIDRKLERTKDQPRFFSLTDGTKTELPLFSSVNGRALISMPLEERVQLAQSKRDEDASIGIFDVVKLAFTEQFGTPSAEAGEIVYAKLDPQR